MITVNKLVPHGRGLAPVLLRRAASVELGWDERQKSRLEATDSTGRQVGIFLPRGSVLRGGDVLVAEDGSLLRVLAAPQPVLVVRACAQHGTPRDLPRAAYHLGNRHVPLEVQADHLKLEPDHVLADMLRSQHLIVSAEDLPFEPEGGAYGAAGHGHGAHDHAEHDHSHGHAPAKAAPGAHDHDHDHDHDHAQSGHDHGSGADARKHDHKHDQKHEHKPDHKHDTKHDHGHDHGHGGHHHD